MYVLMRRENVCGDGVNFEYEDYPISVHVTSQHASNQMRFLSNYEKIPFEELYIVEVDCPDM